MSTIDPHSTKGSAPNREDGAALPDYELDETRPSLKKRIARWWWLYLVLGIGILAVGLVVWGLPAYRDFKVRRALGLIADGEKLTAEGDTEEGFRKFSAAFSIAPGDPQVLRAVALHQANAGDPRALEQLAEFLDSPEPGSPEDLLAIARAALAQNRPAIVSKALDALPPGDLPPTVQADRKLIEAGLLVSQGSVHYAKRLLEETVFPEEKRGAALLTLARLALLGQSPANTVIGYAEDAAALGGVESADALRFLLSLRPLPDAAVVRRWMDRLKTHPHARPDDMIVMMSARLEIDPAQRETLLAEVDTAAKAMAQPDRLRIAEWLGTLGEGDRARALFDAGELDDAQVLSAVSAALLRSSHAAESKTLLAEHGDRLDPPLSALFLACAEMQLGNTDAENAAWEDMQRQVGTAAAPALRTALALMQGLKRDGEMIAIYRQLMKVSKLSTPELLQFAAILPRSSPVPESIAILEELAARMPESPDISASLLYYRVLAERDTAGLLAEAERAYKDNGNSPGFAMPLMMVRALAGDGAGAMRLLNEAHPHPERGDKPVRVAAALVYNAVGWQERAQQLAASVALTERNPEEMRLLAGLDREPTAATVGQPEPVTAPISEENTGE